MDVFTFMTGISRVRLVASYTGPEDASNFVTMPGAKPVTGMKNALAAEPLGGELLPPVFPPPPPPTDLRVTTNVSVAAYASSFIKSASATPERNTTKEVLNCLRILQRVLPVVFEAQGDSNTFESELLWKREAETEDGEPITESQFVIEDDENESDQEGNTVKPSTAKPKTRWLPSLGEKLLTSITDLLFCCGFTLPKTIQVDHHKINYVIWYVIEFKLFAWFTTIVKGKGHWIDRKLRQQRRFRQ